MASSSSYEDSGKSTPRRLRSPYLMNPGIRKALHHMEKYNKRCATDRYWSVFFIAIFITWIITCQYVVVIHHGKDYDILSDNSTDAKSISDLIEESDYSGVPENSITMENTSEFVHKEIDNKTNYENNTDKEITVTELCLFILDCFTGNLYRLQEIIDKGSITMLILYIAIPIGHLINIVHCFCNNRMLVKHSRILGATLLFVALVEHLLGAFYTKHFSLLPSHEKLAFWVLPEISLLLIWSSKMYPIFPPKDFCSDKFTGYSICCNKYVVGVGITVIVAIELLFMYTTYVLEHVAWGSTFFYMIAGGSCYLAFTIYYFGKMTIACAFHIAKNSHRLRCEHLSHALSTVVGCHFGTVCYQATLIFPRIHVTFVMNESSLKTLSTYPRVLRFFFTHSIYTYSTTFTGVIGSNYSDSMRELLRYCSNEVIGCNSVFNFSAIFNSTAYFLLSINSLILISIWNYGLDDPSFSLATYAMYLKMMFMFNLIMKLWKVSSDAILFGVHRDALRDAADHGGFSIFMFNRRYYNEFNSSDELSDGDESDAGSNESHLIGVYRKSLYHID